MDLSWGHLPAFLLKLFAVHLAYVPVRLMLVRSKPNAVYPVLPFALVLAITLPIVIDIAPCRLSDFVDCKHIRNIGYPIAVYMPLTLSFLVQSFAKRRISMRQTVKRIVIEYSAAVVMFPFAMLALMLLCHWIRL